MPENWKNQQGNHHKVGQVNRKYILKDGSSEAVAVSQGLSQLRTGEPTAAYWIWSETFNFQPWHDKRIYWNAKSGQQIRVWLVDHLTFFLQKLLQHQPEHTNLKFSQNSNPAAVRNTFSKNGLSKVSCMKKCSLWDIRIKEVFSCH